MLGLLMKLVIAKELLLQSEALFLMFLPGLLCYAGQFVEGLQMQLRLPSQLLPESPVLYLPYHTRAESEQYHDECGPDQSGDKTGDRHSTALARSHSSTRSCNPLSPPLIRRVMVMKSSLSARAFKPLDHQYQAADSAAQ